MNKTTHFLIRIAIVIVISAMFCATSVQPASANGAPPPEPEVGGAAPYHPQKTNVQMLSETVLLDVLANPRLVLYQTSNDSWSRPSNMVRVSASFTMRNQGRMEEKMQVVFPLTRLDVPWLTSSYDIIPSSFVARVNGQVVPTTEITTPPELSSVPEDWRSVTPPDGVFYKEVRWAAFEATFPVQKDVLLQVEYWMNCDYQGVHQIDYIIETGAGWYGNILSADIIVRLPYPATSESVPQASLGHIFSGNEVRWKMKNFKPKRKDNLRFSFIDTELWPRVLELRSRITQYPDDAEAWHKLGQKYRGGAFWALPDGIHVRNQHLIGLSVEAFEKAAALRPDWGEAHLGLANVLWLKLQSARIKSNYVLENPVVQRVLKELDLAKVYGVTDERGYDWLVDSMNAAFPNLKLPTSTPIFIVLASVPPPPTAIPAFISDPSQRPIAIAAGGYSTCVLTTDKIVKCGVSTPRVMNAMAIAVGSEHRCILTTAGTVKCDGRNDFGQLGDGTIQEKDAFVDVVGMTNGVATLVAGDNHTCALMTGGKVKCWGRNYLGQLGNGTTAYSTIPMNVTGLTDVVKVLEAGNNHTCALLITGKVMCWGANEAGQLGDGSLVNRLQPVVAIELSSDVIALAAGFSHTCALTSQGEVKCWGDNSYGQLGDGSTTNHLQPVNVIGLDDSIMALAAGNNYTCALSQNGDVKCWGHNLAGQLGDKTTVIRSVPVDVIGLVNGVIALAAGNYHTCALLDTGKVKCWGIAVYGDELGIQPTPTPQPTHTARPIPRTWTPKPSPTATLTASPPAMPVKSPASTSEASWVIGLLLAVGVLAFLLWRARFLEGNKRSRR